MKSSLLKRCSTGLGIAAALVVITCIGVAAYLVTNRRPTNVQESKQLPIAGVITALSGTLVDHFDYLHWATPSLETGVGYPVPGYGFQMAVPVDMASTTYIDNRTTDERAVYADLNATLPQVVSYLVSQGFSPLPADNKTDGLLSAVYFYQRPDAVCQVTVYARLAIACAPVAQLLAAAVQAHSLVAVYTQAVPNSATDVITTPDIRPAKSAGYSIATMAIYNNQGETRVNFYKVGGGTWRLVDLGWYNDPHEDGDIMANCADFESITTVRQAFFGQPCYDSTTRTVRTITE